MNHSKEIVSIAHDLKMIKPPSALWPEPANIYLFKDEDGVSMFDVGCGCIASVERLLNALKSLGWDTKPIKKIVLSHAHPDHIGGMEALLSHIMPELIILHEIDDPYARNPKDLHLSFDIPLCKKRDKEKGNTDGEGFDLLGYFKLMNCAMCKVEINQTTKEGDKIKIGDYNFEVIHTPGHAPGHISLFDASKKLLLAGDILGEIVAWYAPSSGGAIGYLDSLQKVDALDIDLVLPSHGEIIKNPKKAIQNTREKILERDEVIIRALQSGIKTFNELNSTLFDSPLIQFFPGVPIVESHLQKLIKQGKVKKLEYSYELD